MKKISMLSIVFTVLILSAYGQRIETQLFSETTPAFSWESVKINLGKTTQHTPVSAVFKFKNTGGAPLVITSVKAGCGCTTPEYSKEPVYPGGTGFIKATYNAASPGSFSKTVTVIANVEGGTTVLTLEGEVLAEGK
ncbi:MAG: DUF1573 domain-containing protein [Cytophagaceae bacterium]